MGHLSLLLFLSLPFKNLQELHRNLVGASSLWSLFAAVRSELVLCIVDGKPMQGSAPWRSRVAVHQSLSSGCPDAS